MTSLLRCAWVVFLLSAGCGGATTGETTAGGSDGGEEAEGTGGAPGTGGAGGSATGGGGTSGSGGAPISCANAGCAPPPSCDTGCTAPCGCCACGEGEMQGNQVCMGGCWAPLLADAGAAPACQYRGRGYPAGVTFRQGDGCNTCTCGTGAVAQCTEKACTCSPAAEAHQREYVGMSPEECAAIRYLCASNTTPFANACGCGCEEDASCPDWFNCEPSPGGTPCDTQALKAMCPYSGFAF